MTFRTMLAPRRPAARRRASLRLEPLADRALPSATVVNDWNEELLQSLTVNTAPVPMARNMALVSVAMFDAVNSIDRSFEPYYADVQASRGASKEAAAAQAAYDTLVALYPSRVGAYNTQLAESLAGIDPDRAAQGIAVGREVARQIWALRANDRSSPGMSWTPPDNDPGTYQLTPVAPPGTGLQPAGNFHVQFITPYAIENNFQFRPGPFPALDTPEYAEDLNEVKVVGASDADQFPAVDRDGNGLPDRTADQTVVAELWRTALGNHTVWNRIAQNQAATNDLSVTEAARLFALLNMSLNDGLQTSYESKYHYELWRPLTAVQRADNDTNPDTVGEPTWMTEHPNTPPYPAYASNASTIGAACATVLTDVFGGNVSFQVNWTQGPRRYANFWAAADEQAEARIFGGIHFRFDCEAGQQIGADVGSYVVANYLQPRDVPSAFGSGREAEFGEFAVEARPDVPPDVSYEGLTVSGTGTVDTGWESTEPAVDPVMPEEPAGGVGTDVPPAGEGGEEVVAIGTDLPVAGPDELSGELTWR